MTPGMGIPAQAQGENLRGVPAGGIHRARPEGTGLGLPLAKRFVELHGGRLWVDEPAGTGEHVLRSRCQSRTQAEWARTVVLSPSNQVLTPRTGRHLVMSRSSLVPDTEKGVQVIKMQTPIQARALLVIGVMAALARSLVTASGGTSAKVSASDDKTQREADLYEIDHVEKAFHRAGSTHDVNLMMSLWAPGGDVQHRYQHVHRESANPQVLRDQERRLPGP